MRVISKKRLRQFWERHPNAAAALRAWFREVEQADWDMPARVKDRYRSASIVGDNRVVFNIKGNDYRLVVKINYRYRTVYVRFVGHARGIRRDRRRGGMTMDIKPIRTEQDYEAALARVDDLMDAEIGTPEGEELDVLVDLVEAYESRHVPMGYPSAVEAIEFRMEQDGLSPRDLVPFMGSRAKVSEVLTGKRTITMPMARALHKHLGIPAEVLLRDSESGVDDLSSDLEWSRFPLREMAKRGWISDLPDLAQHAKELVGELIDRAGGWKVARAALYRKNDHLRANAKTDPYALLAWCWQVLATANRNPPSTPYEPGTVTLDFLTQVARLSASEHGPRHAQEFLAQDGILLIIERHLPRTHLDGAALRLGDGRPVIGLTLRYDRIDSFWFCLLHELAHVGRHMDHDSGDAFVDDLSLSKVEGQREDPRESEADEWAAEALIPHDAWQTSTAGEDPTPLAVMHLAQVLHVHPAIVAGRVRHERQNYRLLSQFVGTGQVRSQFSILP